MSWRIRSAGIALLMVVFGMCARAQADSPGVHRVSIRIAGALALVDVTRTMGAALDLDLPPGAAIVDWKILDWKILGATRLRLQSAAGQGDFGLRIAGLAANGPPVLIRYRFTAPLQCRDGRLVLRVPGSLEASPIAADVRVLLTGGGSAQDFVELAGTRLQSTGRGRFRAQAPARAAWELAFGFRDSGPALTVRAAVAPVSATDSEVVVQFCRPRRSADRPPPERVMLVVDRSRSVGLAGLADERMLARGLVEALPSSVRFNAVFFDRTASALFPLPREATREALDLFSAAMAPALMTNGSDLPAALRLAARLSVAANGDSPGRNWLVIITDGALPDLPADMNIGDAAVGDVAVLVLRAEGDDPVAERDRRRLEDLAASVGGVARQLSGRGLADSVRETVAALHAGGDIFSIRLSSGTRGAAVHDVPGSFGPGQGGQAVVKLGGHAMTSLIVRSRWHGRAESIRVIPAHVDPLWMRPLFQAVRRSGAPAPVVRGQMDRGVVRNALSLTYLPRARACYLGRPVKSAADLDLRGRLRLELSLERGEMREAVIRQSTLGHPEIEACLREAAFAVDVPRAMFNDAPVVAALNLVFAPRTPAAQSDASALGREIDLLLGPITFSGDPGDLLDVRVRPDYKTTSSKPAN